MIFIDILWFALVVFFCSNRGLSQPINLSWSRKGLGGLVRFAQSDYDNKVIIGIVDNGVMVGIDSTNGTYLWRSTCTENNVLVQSDSTQNLVASVTFSQSIKDVKHLNRTSFLPTANFRVLNRKTGNVEWSMQRTVTLHAGQKSQFFKNYIPLDIALQPRLESKGHPMMATILNEDLYLYNFNNAQFKLKHIFSKEELKQSLPSNQYTDFIPIRVVSFENDFLLIASLLDSPKLNFLFLKINPFSLKITNLQKITVNTTLDSEIYSVHVDLKANAVNLYTVGKLYQMDLNPVLKDSKPFNQSFPIDTDVKDTHQELFKRFSNNISVVQTETGIIEINTENKRFVLPKKGHGRLVDSLFWFSNTYHGVLSFDDFTLLGLTIQQSKVSVTWINDEALSTLSVVQVAHLNHALAPLYLSNLFYSFYKFPLLSIKQTLRSVVKITSTLYKAQAKHYEGSLRQNSQILIASSFKACALLGLQPLTGRVQWKRYCPQTLIAQNGVKQYDHTPEPFLRKLQHFVSETRLQNYPQILILPGRKSSNTQSKHDDVVVLWSSQKASWISPESGEDLSPIYDLPFSPNASIQIHSVFYSNEDVVLIDKETKQTIYLSRSNTSLLQNRSFQPLYSFDAINSTLLIGTQIYPTLLGRPDDIKVKTTWSFNFALSQETIQFIAAPHLTTQASLKVKFNENVQLDKFDTTNHILVSTIENNTGEITIYLFNTLNGWLVMSRRLPLDAVSITKMLLNNNRAIIVYISSTTLHQHLLSIELYDSFPLQSEKKSLFNISFFSTFQETQNKSNFNSPIVLSRTFVLVENDPKVMQFTETRYGVTPCLLLMVNQAGQLVKLTQQDIAASRPYNEPSRSSDIHIKDQFTELGALVYTPLIRKTEEHLFSMRNQILEPQDILTFTDQFESVCNVFIYGLDLFFSNIRPVTGFDSYNSALAHYSLPLTIVLGGIAVCILRRKALKSYQLSEWK